MFDPDGDHNELEELIVRHIAEMASMTVAGEEYTKAANQLKTLMEARKIDQETEKIDEEAAKIGMEAEKAEKDAQKLVAETEKIAQETVRMTAEIEKMTAETLKITRETEKMDPEIAKTTAEAAKLEQEASKLLAETRQIEQKTDNPWRPSPDQLVAAGATFATVAAVLAFEMRGVITSKSFGWIPKVKI